MSFENIFALFFNDTFKVTRMVEEFDEFGTALPGKPKLIGNIKGQFKFLSASDTDRIPNPALTANAVAYMKNDSNIKQDDVVEFDNNKYTVVFVYKLSTHFQVYLKLSTENYINK